MIQIIALLVISWILLWLFTKKDLAVLGLVPMGSRMKYFVILLSVSALLSASAFLLRMYYIQEKYVMVQTLRLPSVLLETWYQFRQVFTEELLCRGALLYILIKKAGKQWAIIISSVVFAALHWFNEGVWGNGMQMIIVFSFTCIMGLLLAYAYVRTFSLLVPLAIHLGWNITQNYIFPGSETGPHIFVLAGTPPTVTISYLAFFTMLLFPKISVLLVDYFIVKTHRPVAMP